MSEFSIEALDAAARGVSSKTQPIEPQKKKLFGQNVSDMQPTLQAEPDAPMPTQPQDNFSFDMKNLDKQAFQVATGQIKAPKQSGSSSLATFGQGLASLADTTIGGVIPAIAGAATYAGARAAQQTPEQAQALQQKIVGLVDKPFGKIAGVTETAGYKGEA